MMISTQTSSFQLGSTLNTPQNAQSTFSTQGSSTISKQQNKLKIAIRPQNEYQVYQNNDNLIQLKDGGHQNSIKKQQQLAFSTSLMKIPSHGTLNKSNIPQGMNPISTELSETMTNHTQNLPLQKKNSCIALTLPSKTIYGGEKISSPKLPLTAKAAEQKQNNFYFASKNSKINKRTIFKFNDKIWDTSKKPSQSGVVIVTQENSPNIQQAFKSNAPSSLAATSRTSIDGGTLTDKKMMTMSNFNKLTAYIQTEHVSRVEEKQHSNNNSKLSPNGHQQNMHASTNNSSNSSSTMLMEYRKLQLANYKQQLKIQQLEKLCQEQEEKLREKDMVIAAYENKSQSGSTSNIASVNTTTTKTIIPKQQVKIPSLLNQNNTHHHHHTMNNEQANHSQNNSFNTNDKKNFSNSTAQMSVSLIKSQHSPQRSILHSSTISIAKGLQHHPQSTNDLISPKNSKHKTKLLSINLQNSEVKDLIKNSHFNNQQQFSYQPHFNELYSDKVDNDYEHGSMIHLISPNKEQTSAFNFQTNHNIGSSHFNQSEQQQSNIQEGLQNLLERVKKVLQAKKQKQ